MKVNMEKSRLLQKRAATMLPIGVNSNFRYWGEDITFYMDHARGCYLWDVDGNCFIDYRMAFGPIILGHAVPEVDQFVFEEIQKGSLCAMTSELELEVAEMIIELCPGVEMVRFACSGTEATMHALRTARAYTGREKVIKFEGMYHGFHDYTLWSTYAPAETYGNRYNPIAIPASSGIPKSLGELIIPIPFNDFEVFEKVIVSHGSQIAAVIMEPCLGNCAAIEPLPGFLDFVRKLCTEYGIVMILDEVKTGFRIAKGGAQEFYGIKPDLATYAKSLANGYPLAAFGGRKEIMSMIGDGVAQGGTFNNNKPGVAAAYMTLKLLSSKPVLDQIAQNGQRLKDGIKQVFEKEGVQAVVTGYPAMFSFAIDVDQVTSQRDWSNSDRSYYLCLVERLIELGVMPDHDAREPWFLCHAHDQQVIDHTLEQFERAVKDTKDMLCQSK